MDMVPSTKPWSRPCASRALPQTPYIRHHRFSVCLSISPLLLSAEGERQHRLTPVSDLSILLGAVVRRLPPPHKYVCMPYAALPIAYGTA